MRGWADVGLWVAVCFLRKFLYIYKTMFARLTKSSVTQSQAISQSIAFHHFQVNERDEKVSLFFSFFKTLFYTKLPFPLPWWSKDLLVENLQVAGGQRRHPPVQFRRDLCRTAFGDRPASRMCKFSASVNSEFRNGSFWLEIRDAVRVDRCSWKCTRVWSCQQTSDLSGDAYFYLKCLQWSCLKAVSAYVCL